MKDNMDLVTIIMPAYNAAAYLDSSICSVIDQTYENWELIIINDGSTDNSKCILETYKKTDNRIIVIHKENEGVSAARNIGLDLAKGKYIVFLDADDLLTPDSINHRIELIQGSEIGIANYLKIGTKTNYKPFHCPSDKWYSDQLCRNIIAGVDYGYQGYLWNKIFLHEIIEKNKIYFQKGIAYNEDRLFCYEYALFCKTANLSEKYVYIYRLNDNSAMANIGNFTDTDYKKLMTEFESYNAMKNLAKKYNKKRDLGYIFFEETMTAIGLKKRIDKHELKIQRTLNGIIRSSGIKAIFVGKHNLYTKIKLFGHIILMR